MNEETQGLDYAQMLEIPVSTVNVVRKRSLFRRRKPEEDLKDRVVESVNERVEGASAEESFSYVRTEDLSEPPAPVKEKKSGLGKILIAEAVAACLIAAGIFLTNVFVPNTAINAFMGSLTAVKEKEAAYTEFKLTPVVSETSDAEMSVTDDGVLHFTEKTSVYPVCDGEIASVTRTDGVYTVKIAHTSAFTSVFTGLDTVYAQVGDDVAANIPFAYSNGESEVRVSMYDGETQLNCYSLSGVVPVWNS